MKRREFITLLGGAVVWPLTAGAQPAEAPVIGFLDSRSPESDAALVEAFRSGLEQIGFTEGRNVTVDYRWARDRSSELPELAAALVRRPVAVLVAIGGAPSALAAAAATSSIPIVFANGSDPVALGLVASLNRPGRNVTGVTVLTVEIGVKLLEMLTRAVPSAKTIALLINPGNPNAKILAGSIEEGARALGRQLVTTPAVSGLEIERALASLASAHVDALIVSSDPLFTNQRELIVASAARHALPAIYSFREHTAAGGLMSYGTSLTDAIRQAGQYTGRILKGEKPADLPVQQATRFELVINLKTARALGLAIPPTLLALADEVIE